MLLIKYYIDIDNIKYIDFVKYSSIASDLVRREADIKMSI